jgi:hypothetical protein
VAEVIFVSALDLSCLSFLVLDGNKFKSNLFSAPKMSLHCNV